MCVCLKIAMRRGVCVCVCVCLKSGMRGVVRLTQIFFFACFFCSVASGRGVERIQRRGGVITRTAPHNITITDHLAQGGGGAHAHNYTTAHARDIKKSVEEGAECTP